MIRGRVIATASIEEIALVAASGRVGQLRFGNTEAPARIPLPDGSVALQHTFALTMPVAPAVGRARIEFAIVVRTAGNQGAQAAYTLESDPRDPTHGKLVAGRVEAGVADTGILPSAILYPEHLGIDPAGILHLHGWAVAREMVVEVAIEVDEQPVGRAQIGGAREDVAQVHAAYPNAGTAGFTFQAPLGAALNGAGNLRVRATLLTGSTLETVLPLALVERLPAAAAAHLDLTPTPAPSPHVVPPPPAPPDIAPSDPGRVIVFYCDEISLGTDGFVSVRGWAVCPVGMAGVSVLLDGKPVGDAETGMTRSDVADAYPDIAAARTSGFRLRGKALDSASGEHVVTIIARNSLGDTRQHRQGVVAQAINRNVLTRDSHPAPQAPPPKSIEFKLDSPVLSGNAMPELVTGRLTIEGWVLARTGVDTIAVLLDDQPIGSAHYGIVRPEIGSNFPDRPDALRCGFVFHCPSRSLRDGDHTVQLRVTARDGDTHVETFRVTVAKSAGGGDGARIRRRIPRAEALLYADRLRQLDMQPQFHVVLRDAAAAAPDRLASTLASLQGQIYPRWSVSLVGDTANLRAAIAALVAEGRIDPARIDFLDDRAAAQRFAPDPAGQRPTLLGVLSAGDQLGCDALAEFALHASLHREAELLYADELRENPATGQREPFFKPAFSPDLLCAMNYIGRPWFVTATLLGRVGASPRSIQQLGEYALLLRCAEQAGPGGVGAIPRLLCERVPGGGEAPETEIRALAHAAKRRGLDAIVEPGCLPGIWRVHGRIAKPPKVSMIVATSGTDRLIRTCIAALRRLSGQGAIEIVAIDDLPAGMAKEKAWLRKAADKVVDQGQTPGWAASRNRAAAAANGKFLLFIDDDVEPTQREWLDALLDHAERPEIGVVGPRLLYSDGKVQHAGLFLAEPGVARHAFRYAAAEEPGYFGLARTPRNVMAVGSACMMIRRDTFTDLGGFDEAPDVADPGLDFCLRTHEAGLLAVYTPHATLTHHDQAIAAQAPDRVERVRFARRWRMRFAEGDPYFSPNLSRRFGDYRPIDEPTHAVSSAHPLLRAEDIRRILAVKVDDIGDFITALPAIRRLKGHFPAARITVLAAAAARAFAALEPAIDETIVFSFAQTRSAVGKREASSEELAALTALLAPYRFDLAIDLHKNPDTRALLRCAGAPITAGFDHLGRFPWLDVALEWEGDRRLRAKRAHAADDLLHLVDAVATAARDDRTAIAAEAVARLRVGGDLDSELRKFLADAPLVCVQAGAASPLRQWPVGHFVALIDLLLARNLVRVALLGGSDDADIAEQILAAVSQPDRVLSLVGRLSMEALPEVIARAALSVGNDGGPKHIAAALAVPTVAVQSGVVDPVEWAPLGPIAIAAARAMTCSPCYLSRLDDCPRGFACMTELEPRSVHRLCEMMLARRVPGASEPALITNAKPARKSSRPSPAKPAPPPASPPLPRPATPDPGETTVIAPQSSSAGLTRGSLAARGRRVKPGDAGPVMTVEKARG